MARSKIEQRQEKSGTVNIMDHMTDHMTDIMTDHMTDNMTDVIPLQ